MDNIDGIALEKAAPLKITKKKDRTLPDYLHAEEVFNMVSHAAGAVLGLVVLIISLSVAALNQNAWGIAASIVYGLSMILLYTVSSVYHGLKASNAKKVFRILDHCTIYLLIAGTYTPILLTAIRTVSPATALVFMLIEWGVAALAVILTAIDLKKYEIFSMICYIVLGWGIITIPGILFAALPFAGGALLLSGGVAYTVGAILYGIGKKVRYMHSVFHICCVIGSLLQFLCIILYCL